MARAEGVWMFPWRMDGNFAPVFSYMLKQVRSRGACVIARQTNKFTASFRSLFPLRGPLLLPMPPDPRWCVLLVMTLTSSPLCALLYLLAILSFFFLHFFALLSNALLCTPSLLLSAAVVGYPYTDFEKDSCRFFFNHQRAFVSAAAVVCLPIPSYPPEVPSLQHEVPVEPAMETISAPSSARRSFQARPDKTKGTREERKVEFINSSPECLPSALCNAEWGSPFSQPKPPTPIRTAARVGYALANLPPASATKVDPIALVLLDSMRGVPSAIDDKRFANDYNIRTQYAMRVAAQGPTGPESILGEVTPAEDTLDTVSDTGRQRAASVRKVSGGKKKQRKDNKGRRRSSSAKSDRRRKSTSSSRPSSSMRSSSSAKKASPPSAAAKKSPEKEKRKGAAPTDKRDAKAKSPQSSAAPNSAGAARTGTAKKSPSKGNKNAEAEAVKPSPSLTPSARTALRKGGKGQSGTPKDVTQMSLKKINMSQFARMKPKQKHKAMITEFVNAYEMGIKIFEEDYAAELAHVEKLFREQSHDIQAREINRLVYAIKYIRMDCQQKLSLAESVVNALVSGVENLLEQMRNTGARLLQKDSTLIFEAPFIGPDPTQAEGVPMPEVRGAESVLTEPHPVSLKPNEAAQHAIHTIHHFFHGQFDFIREDMLHLTGPVVIPAYDKVRDDSSQSRSQTISSVRGEEERGGTKIDGTPISVRSTDNPPKAAAPRTNVERRISMSSGGASTTSTVSAAVPQRDAAEDRAGSAVSGSIIGSEELAAYSAYKREETEKVRQRVRALTDAMAHLLDRIERQHEKFRSKISAQQRALDEGSTHRKAADDIMENQKHREDDAKQATAMARELGMELRTRMDKAEADMRETIQKVLDDSALVSHENMAYRDYSALEDKKADCESYVMSRMVRSMLDQAEIMRDLQFGIMNMWNKSHPSGREEKNTAIHRTLPDAYNTVLKRCGRETLLRLVYHLSKQNDESLRTLMGALDEHEHFLNSHTQEADAVKQEEAMLAAVTTLMKTMYTEGRIHSNPNKMSSSLPETISFMVEQYNAFMGFTEGYARALIRREDRHRSKTTVPYFSEEAQLPAVLKAIRETTKNPCPFSPSLYPKPEAKRLAGAGPKSHPAEAHTEPAAAPDTRQPGTPWPGAQLPRLKPTPAEVVTALHRANPSEADPRKTNISVVGNGRWDGQEAIQSTVPATGPVPSFVTRPRVPYRRVREPTVLTKAMEMEAANKKVLAPGPPARTGLNEYVMENYSHKLDELMRGDTALPDPAKTMKKYNNPDAQFLERQLVKTSVRTGKEGACRHRQESSMCIDLLLEKKENKFEYIGNLGCRKHRVSSSSRPQQVDEYALCCDLLWTVKFSKFVMGEEVYMDGKQKEKRQRLQELYNQIMARQAEARAKKWEEATAGMNRWEKAKLMMRNAAASTTPQAAQMALLNHCTTAHAAEVALEQNIDVRDLVMKVEQRPRQDGVGYEDVVVGLIDAPNATGEEVHAFSQALQKACPVARRMEVEWQQVAPASRSSAEEELKTETEASSETHDAGPAPLGTPGAHRATAAPEGRRRSAFDSDTAFTLPGVPVPVGYPVSTCLRTVLRIVRASFMRFPSFGVAEAAAVTQIVFVLSHAMNLFCCSRCFEDSDAVDAQLHGPVHQSSVVLHAQAGSPTVLPSTHRRSDGFATSSRRDQASQALLDALNEGCDSIPTPQWRAKYGKVRGIGTVVTFVLATFLSRQADDPADAHSFRSRSTSLSGSMALLRTEGGALRRNHSSHGLRQGGHGIHTIDLRGLRISDADFAKLVPVLMEDPVIRKVHLCGNAITDAGVDDLIAQINDGVCSSGVEAISFTQNPITIRGVVAFLQHCANLPFLKRLEMSVGPSDGTGGVLSKEDLPELRTSLSKSSLRQLFFRGNGMPSAAACLVLCDVLELCSALRQFVCLGVPFGTTTSGEGEEVNVDEPIEDGASRPQPIHVLRKRLIAPHSTLTSVILRTPLTLTDVTVLAEGISASHSLAKLVLSRCELTAECFRIIGRSLRRSHTLRHLDLSYPHPSVAEVLGGKGKTQLQRHTSYEYGGNFTDDHHKMSFARDVIHESPLAPLMESLRAGAGIEELMLVGVGISIADVEHLCDTMERYHNRSLVHVSLTFPGSEALVLKLSNLILRNRLTASRWDIRGGIIKSPKKHPLECLACTCRVTMSDMVSFRKKEKKSAYSPFYLSFYGVSADMDLGPFSFEGIADGMASAHTYPVKRSWIVDRRTYNEWNPSKWITRELDTSALCGPDGKPLSDADKESVSTWRTNKSFSGRCGLGVRNAVVTPNLQESDERVAEIRSVVPQWLSQAPHEYRNWSAQFYLRSSAELPNILLTVAPYYFPYTAELDLAGPLRGPVKPFDPLPSTPEERWAFDRKMLHTPLIWEEPYALSFEVNKDGIFLWSETWELYGTKVGELGMRTAKNMERFNDIAPILQRSLDFETYPGLSEPPIYEAFLHELSGIYEYSTAPAEVGNGAEADVSDSGGSGSDSSSGDSLYNQVRIVPHLQFIWEEVETRRILIPCEAVNAFFTPYVTLGAGSDGAIIVGGSTGVPVCDLTRVSNALVRLQRCDVFVLSYGGLIDVTYTHIVVYHDKK
eukprot:gene7230-5081_t